MTLTDSSHFVLFSLRFSLGFFWCNVETIWWRRPEVWGTSCSGEIGTIVSQILANFSHSVISEIFTYLGKPIARHLTKAMTIFLHSVCFAFCSDISPGTSTLRRPTKRTRKTKKRRKDLAPSQEADRNRWWCCSSRKDLSIAFYLLAKMSIKNCLNSSTFFEQSDQG